MQLLVDFQRLSKVPAGSKGGNRCLNILPSDYVKLPTLAYNSLVHKDEVLKDAISKDGKEQWLVAQTST